MTDKLIINNLTAKCQIGLTEEERATPQTIWIDLELAVDAAKAALRDRVEDAVDYAELISEVQATAQRAPYNLLETLADHLAILILGRFKVPWVRVKVKKRALPGIDHAAVEVERCLARALRSRPGSASTRVRRRERALSRR